MNFLGIWLLNLRGVDKPKNHQLPMGVEPKIGGKPPKMDGTIIFGNTPMG